MNGAHKWHKATGPAFNPGEVWISHAGNIVVTIVEVRKYPGAAKDSNHTSDYGVTYEWLKQDGTVQQHEKDAWNFQVRYGHIADRTLKVNKCRG